MTAVDERARGAELDAAEKELAEAEQTQNADSPELCPRLEKLAGLYLRDGLYAKAELLYRRATDIIAKSGNSEALAVALSRLGMLYRTEEKFDDAEAVYLRALAAAEQVEDCARTRAERLACLAGLYVQKNELSQAEELLKKATAAYQAAFGQHSCYSRLTCMGLAYICQVEGKNGEADEYFERSRADSAADTDGHGDERALLELAQVYYAQARMAEVAQILSQTVFSDEDRLWPEHPRVAAALHERAELFRAQGYYNDAEKAFRSALDIRERILGPAHPEVAATAMALGVMLLSQNRCADAEPVLKLAMKTRVRAFGVENPSVAAVIETFAALLKRTKRGAIASKLEARARDIRSRLVWQANQAAQANANRPS